jgi:hypothetical protein
MSYANPTPLYIGAPGTLKGWRTRVAGRAVMSMEDGGARYSWHEFFLVGDDGETATLVHEEGEQGPEWKLFRWLEPRAPITAAEARKKKVGDTVALDGHPTPVTLVDQSRVDYLEGEIPEGVTVGDIANYFNADAGNRMLVASWTGDEIEFYQGFDLADTEVAQAFGFSDKASRSAGVARSQEAFATSTRRATRYTILAAAVVVLVVVLAAGLFSLRKVHRTAAPGGTAAPAPAGKPALVLKTGDRLALAGTTWTVSAAAVAQVGRKVQPGAWREYPVANDAGARALLVNGLSGSPSDWHLLRPVEPPRGLAPQAAAALRTKTEVNWTGQPLRIRELLTTVETAPAGQPAPARHYGFIAGDVKELLLVRWTETEIEALAGPQIADPAVRAAVTPAPPALP